MSERKRGLFSRFTENTGKIFNKKGMKGIDLRQSAQGRVYKKIDELSIEELRDLSKILLRRLGDTVVASAILKSTAEAAMKRSPKTGDEGALEKASIMVASNSLRDTVEAFEEIQKKFGIHLVEDLDDEEKAQ